jgi:hypothetical protein
MSIDFTGLAKSYLEGRNEFHVHVLFWNGGEYCALIYNAEILNEQALRYGLAVSPGYKVVSPTVIKSPLIIDCHKMNVSVFVDDIKPVKLPQASACVGINTGIWLLALEDCFEYRLYSPVLKPPASLGRRFSQGAIKPIDFLASITLDISSDAIKLGFTKGVNKLIQSCTVRVRPLQLGLGAFEARIQLLYATFLSV